MFVLGCPTLTVAVDHKPLIRIFNNRALEDIDNLLKFKERSLRYRYEIVHVPGTKHAAPDATSRYPTAHGAVSDDDTIDRGLTSSVKANINQCTVYAVTWEIVEAAATNNECIALTRIIEHGFLSTREQMPENLRILWHMKDSLYTIEGVPPSPSPSNSAHISSMPYMKYTKESTPCWQTHDNDYSGQS